MLPYYLSQIDERLKRLENSLPASHFLEESAEYIDTKEAAILLKFTVPTLYTKVCKGEIPSFKRGNRLYFSRTELIEWIENGKKSTNDSIEAQAQKIARGLR